MDSFNNNRPPYAGNHHGHGNYRNKRRRRQFRRDRDERRPGIPSNPFEGLDLSVPADKQVIIGVTGEPGAGKTALAREFAKLGAEILDVDSLGHETLDGPATQKKLVDTFGGDILGEDGKVSRPALAAKAFVNAETAAQLNAIVHPQLSRRVKMAAKKLSNFAIIDAALLHELGLNELCSTTVYVRANRELRLLRVRERGWDEDELKRREIALGDAEARAQACALIIENTGDARLITTYAKTILARQLGIDPFQPRQGQNQNPVDNEDDSDLDEDDDADDQEMGLEKPEPPLAAQAPAQSGPREIRLPQTATPVPPQQPPIPEREPVHADLSAYLRRPLADLQTEADQLGVREVRALDRHDLINEILRRVAGGRMDDIIVEGFIEAQRDNGYIRSPLNSYHSCATDTFIPNQIMRRYGLRPGMHVVGRARAPRGNERCPQMLALSEIMNTPADERTSFPRFEDLVPLHADDRLFMERSDQPHDYSLRIIDLIAPIGKGQRGLLVAQPKCGKTVYLQKIANAITTNNPDVSLIILLIDERPEEVTDMERHVKGEVIASTFDQPASRHVQVAEIAINKAKRLVERGKDVVILLDSITRLARAYNTEAPSSGRIMSGGIEATALIKPKQFFGAARNIENGGSLTILATCLVDTGSVMDTVIFEEFKGTGNMELVLDRRLANKGIYPAVDPSQSGTRRDELIVKTADEHQRLQMLRRFLADRSPQDAIEFLKNKLKEHKSNIEFLLTIDPKRGNFNGH